MQNISKSCLVIVELQQDYFCQIGPRKDSFVLEQLCFWFRSLQFVVVVVAAAVAAAVVVVVVVAAVVPFQKEEKKLMVQELACSNSTRAQDLRKQKSLPFLGFLVF